MTSFVWWLSVAMLPSMLTSVGLMLCSLENRRPARALPERRWRNFDAFDLALNRLEH